jgi:hypothetical protein
LSSDSIIPTFAHVVESSSSSTLLVIIFASTN